MGLEGRVIVVTGASRGLGEAIASAAADAGAAVVGIDIEPIASDERIVMRTLDVTDENGWRDFAAWLRAEHGACHGLVNNAGMTMRSRLEEVSLADWNRTLALNVTGPMLGMQTLVDLMPPGSSIVNIASIAALTGHFAVAYTASKWALRGLSRAASLELGPRDIRVNAVMPRPHSDGDDCRRPAGGVRSAHQQRAARPPRDAGGRRSHGPVPAEP